MIQIVGSRVLCNSTTNNRIASLSNVRVLHLVTDLALGGTPLVLAELLPRLAAAGLDVHAACLADAGAVAQRLERSGIPVWPLGAGSARDILVLARLAGLLKRLEPRILHTSLVHCNVAGRVVGRLVGVPRIVSTVCTAEHIVGWHLWLENATCRLADKITCNSESVRRFMNQAAHIPNSKLVTIYRGVDVDSIAAAKPADRADLGISGTGPLVCFVGRLDPVKGLRYLLEAMVQVRRSVPAELMIVGDGPIRRELEQYADKLGISSVVHWLGFRQDVGSLLKASDLFVLPSLQEGLPVALAQAMAAGVPVAATTIEGTSDLICNGRAGLLVRPCDSAALGGAILKLLTDRALAQTMAAQAKRTVEENFTIARMVREHLELYQRVLTS